MALGDDLRSLAIQADLAEVQLATAQSQLASALQQGIVDQQEIERLTAELAACQGSNPPPKTTRFGACPTKGGNIAGVVSKWGNGAAIRSFVSGGFITVSVPASAGPIHQSWKPAIGSPINGANVAAACTNFREGDYVEVWHEADVKFRNGSINAAQAQQIADMKNWFYDAVHSVRPDLLVPATYAAWMFEDALYLGSSTDPGHAEFWSRVKADVVGIDCDAYANLTRYPDFSRPVANVKDYIARHGYAGWSVPEMIHPRIASDPTGTQRAAWLTKEATRMRDNGAAYVTAYDFDYRPNQELKPGSPEFTAYQAFI